jgi:hypothetical protein
MAHIVWTDRQVQEENADYLQYLAGSDVIMAFNKGRPSLLLTIWLWRY